MTPPPWYWAEEQSDLICAPDHHGPHTDWYWNKTGGHFLVSAIGRYRNWSWPRYICEIPIGWHQFVRPDVLGQAYDKYYKGLLDFATREPDTFRIRFGTKYWHQSIHQFADRKWFEWIIQQPSISRVHKYEPVIRAIETWLEKTVTNPLTDGGRLLDPSLYESDLLEFSRDEARRVEELRRLEFETNSQRTNSTSATGGQTAIASLQSSLEMLVISNLTPTL
ncbi:hypothetical protein FRB94_014397 [Tulasnella sp. JGI-2019a]|nr:hypothetical protein FRB94_014397 [Tulasnella sp. JGI-2019a]KAG9008617.1 hypothetical protein FRB93_006536 [Tulasnella sp. JGI-2019a]KAG9038484.1 hypothetical protein FRB95_001341 [Tulasnella sp. JGI-2019a]